jgi:hypothetical protein
MLASKQRAQYDGDGFIVLPGFKEQGKHFACLSNRRALL